MTNVLLTIAIVVGVGVIGTVGYVTMSVRSFSRRWFGTSDIMKGIQQQQELYDATPKNVSSLTKLELPRIEKDFPEFNWDQWKSICEKTLTGYLEAISHRDTALAGNVSSALREQIHAEIESAFHDEIEDEFEQIHIYDTQIARYEKKPGICRIKVESSVQYLHSRTEKGKEVLKEKMEQNIYITELIYIQDINLAGKYATAFGVNCPNCGAPIKMLGQKVCQFCGTAVEPINIRVWTLHRIDKERTQR